MTTNNVELQAGRVLCGDTPPDKHLVLDDQNQPLMLTVDNPCNTDDTPDDQKKPDITIEQYQYAGPGASPTSNLTPNTNFPWTINKSENFQQPVATNDFWTGLMFRYTSEQLEQENQLRKKYQFECTNLPNPLAYISNYFGTAPWMFSLINAEYDGSDSPYRQGVALYNPDQGQVIPVNIEGSPTSAIGKITNPGPLTIGIGPAAGGERANEIPPYGTAGQEPEPGAQLLNARIDGYSDWGCRFSYGNATDSLAVHVLNGSPFVFFRKEGTGAIAKVWLMGMGDDSKERVNVWLKGANLLGASLLLDLPVLTDQTDANIITVKTNYLIIAPEGTVWNDETTDDNAAKLKRLFTAPMGAGRITAAALPHRVGGTAFEDLSTDQKVAVANYYAGLSNEPATTAASYAFDAASNKTTTTLSFAPADNSDALTLLMPHHWKYLEAADADKCKHTIPGVGDDLEITYSGLLGTNRLLKGAAFRLNTQFHGLLPWVPNFGLFDDADLAAEIYAEAKTWTENYTRNGGSQVIPYYSDTYMTGTLQIGEMIMLFDALAASQSKLGEAERKQARVYRDYFLGELKSALANWFDLTSARLFQYIPKYNTFVGYPTGYQAANNFNDMHFHFAYFLQAFAVVGQYERDFLVGHTDVIDLLVRQVAQYGADDSGKFPKLRYFNPYQGHCWANGVMATQESVAESLLFSSGLIRVGQLLGGKRGAAWKETGIYLYTSEINSAMEYWFNVDGHNWASTYGACGIDMIKNLKQVSIVESFDIMRQVNFGNAIEQNVVQAVDGINWLAPSANSLWLGRMPEAYLAANWEEFIANNNAAASKTSLYENVVAFFQAQIPATGTTIDDPGPAGALLRLEKYPSSDNNLYAGTNNVIVKSIVHALGDLGAPDESITANIPNYAVFDLQGAKTCVAWNPGPDTIAAANFLDASGHTAAALENLAPLELVVKNDQTTRRFSMGTAASESMRLYVRTDKSGSARSLNTAPGTKTADATAYLPANVFNGVTAEFDRDKILSAYANVYDTVPVRSDNNSAVPTDTTVILEYVSGPITGTLIAGEKTVLELYANVLLEPGCLQEAALDGNTLMAEVAYDATGQGKFTDRVETFTLVLGQGFNLWQQHNNGPSGESPGDATVQNTIPGNMSGALPEQLTNGRVRLRLFEGAYNNSNDSHAKTYVSVEAHARTGRQSLIHIPYKTS